MMNGRTFKEIYMDFNNLDTEEIKNLIPQISSLSELLLKLGGDASSQTEIVSLSNFLTEHNIDFSGRIHKKFLSDKEILKENSNASSTSLRRRILKKNLIPYKCAICGIDAIWNNRELVLTLDHINGRNRDNRLENLRWICPNCDSQLPTYGNRTSKTKKEKVCIKCGSPISKKNKSGLCKKCKSHKNAL